MKSKLMLLIVGIGVMLMVVQCDDISSPEPRSNEEEETQDELPAPELISPVNGASNQAIILELKWKKIRGAKEYLIQVSESEDFSDVLVDSVAEGTSMVTPPLEPETIYFWKVSPIKPNYTGPWSEVWQFTSSEGESEAVNVDLGSPESGAELSADDALVFEWEGIEDASGYHYQLAADSSFSDVAVDSVLKSNSVEIEELPEGNEYFWRVSPNLSSATSTWSDTWSFTFGGDENGDDNDDGGDNDGGGNDGGGDDDGGNDDGGNDDGGNDDGGNDDGGNDDGGNDDGGNDGGGNDGGSDEPVPAVKHVSPSDGAEDQSTPLTLEWEEISGVDNYKVQVAEDSDFEDPVVDDTENGTTYTLEDLKEDQMYYWRILPEGGEKWSDFWSFRTEAGEQNNDNPPSSNTGDFVTAENSNFMLNGEVFRFAGTNAYYLPNYEKINTGVVNRALDLFQDTGINVVRMWAFYDGYDCGYSKNDSNENVIQTAPGEYNEEALRDLDRVIAKGKERGIKFNLALLNYWDELGGICQYNTWAGASSPGRNMNFFLNNPDTQKWFKDYIKMLLNRVNTETGIAYKDEPAIFGWQIIGEGRNKGADPRILRDWYQEIARYIKSIDPNHMVATGEEGFDNGTPSEYTSDQYNSNYVLNANEGTSYTLNTAIPEIDYGNAHWYPEDWGMGSGLNLTTQEAWIKDHKKIAENHGKPFVLGEYGHLGWGGSKTLDGYKALWSLAEEIELDGSTLWQLTADFHKCYEFGGNICYPGGRGDTELYNSFRNHIENMKSIK